MLAQSSWLESKVSEGGTSLARVREQLALARSSARIVPGGDAPFRLTSTTARCSRWPAR